ncbi:MAG: hypothetical protein ABSB82_01435 [Terriglobia bacterium]|jgi:hypothetical protein
MGFMKLEDAVRHLASLRLALKMPDGKLHPLSKKLRRPRGVIPLIEAKDGLISKQEVAMIRRTRAAYRKVR